MENKFWEMRSDKYDKLQWVNDCKFIKKVVDTCCCYSDDIVLEVGVGTGTISKILSTQVNTIIGIDVSREMLEQSTLWGEDNINNLYVMKWDARNMPFRDGLFDVVVSRLAIHHITQGTSRAFDEMFRVLKKNGRVVIAEGPPASLRVSSEYAKILKLKEDRIVLYSHDIEDMMRKSGFENILCHEIVLPQLSVRGWVNNSGMPKDTCDNIFNMWINGSPELKEDYNMTVTENDCFVDIKMCILEGRKL